MSRDLDGIDLDTLVREHLPALRGYLASFGAHVDLIDDIAQDVFLEVLRHRDRYDGARPFRSWLFGIARNLINQEFRRSANHARLRRGLATRVLHEHRDEEPDEPLIRFEAAGHVRRCLQALSERARELIVLRFREDLSGEEIARRTGLRSGTVRMGLLRARAALHRCLAQRLAGEGS